MISVCMDMAGKAKPTWEGGGGRPGIYNAEQRAHPRYKRSSHSEGKEEESIIGKPWNCNALALCRSPRLLGVQVEMHRGLEAPGEIAAQKPLVLEQLHVSRQRVRGFRS